MKLYNIEKLIKKVGLDNIIIIDTDKRILKPETLPTNKAFKITFKCVDFTLDESYKVYYYPNDFNSLWKSGKFFVNVPGSNNDNEFVDHVHDLFDINKSNFSYKMTTEAKDKWTKGLFGLSYKEFVNSAYGMIHNPKKYTSFIPDHEEFLRKLKGVNHTYSKSNKTFTITHETFTQSKSPNCNWVTKIENTNVKESHKDPLLSLCKAFLKLCDGGEVFSHKDLGYVAKRPFVKIPEAIYKLIEPFLNKGTNGKLYAP